MAYKIVIDGGHGGADPGAVYEGRQEKDDNLALALSVGRILEQNGIDVVYTRTEDVYDTPFEKATIANNSNADYFVSLHRNAVPTPNTASGIETLVFADRGMAGQIARAINSELEGLGWKNLGVIERPNLVVLKRTKMPAVLVETGFIDNDTDNAMFDEEFDSIAAAIAGGILSAIGVNHEENSLSGLERDDDGQGIDDDIIDYGDDEGSDIPDVYWWQNPSDMSAWPDYRMNEGRMRPDRPQGGNRPQMPDRPQGPGISQRPDRPQAPDNTQQRLYRVQTGAFRMRRYAEELVRRLRRDGFAPFVVYSDGLYRVQVGAFRELDNAVKLEQRLRRLGYNTFISS